MVRASSDVCLSSELLQELLKLSVRLRHEMAPAQHRNFAPLGERGRQSVCKDPRQPGCGAPNKLPPRDPLHTCLTSWTVGMREELEETETVVLAKSGPKIGQIQDASQERSKTHDQSQFENAKSAKTSQPLDGENPLR